MADWENLPEVILGQIFSFLSTTERLCIIGQVCSAWEIAALRPEVWQSFVFCEEDIYPGFDDALDHVRHGLRLHGSYDGDIKDVLINMFVEKISRFGKYFKFVKIYFRGTNSNQIVNCLSQNCTVIEVLKIQHLQTGVNVVRNHESSCKHAIYMLLQKNTGLHRLEVRDMDNYCSISELKHPLPFGAPHSSTLKSLSFFQSFKSSNLGNLMYLVNLRELAIEPQALSYSLLYHLAGRSLTDLHIVAVSKHVEVYTEALQNWQWKEISEQGRKLRVHCHFGVNHDWTEKEIMLKESMPVESLKYQKFILLEYPPLAELVCSYSSTLKHFIDMSISLKSYKLAQNQEIADSTSDINMCILNIVRACPHLKTLAVKEILYSGTILAMLHLNNALNILLMEDQVRYKLEPTPDLSLPNEVKDIITQGSKDKESFELSVTKLTGRKWHFLLKRELISVMLNEYLTFV